MNKYRALLTYGNFLRGLRKTVAGPDLSLDDALESAFAYLFSNLRLQNVGLLWWDAPQNSLKLQGTFYSGSMMEGEEEIMVTPASPLQDLVRDRVPVIVSPKKPWVAYLPLHTGDRLIGAIRLVRGQALPRGKVLSRMSTLYGSHRPPDRRYPLLEDLADILSYVIQRLVEDKKHHKKERYFQAGSEVAAAIFERPRLRDMLEAVSHSIIHNFGFDRIRFYLSDPARQEVKGVLGLQIPDRVLDLEGEVYPLQPRTNAIVDTALAKTGDAQVQASGRVVYMPLWGGEKVVGCLAVDNLLSQQAIDEEQMEALRGLAGQVGLAVLNARLFEDIEQQAITDGLTKLYVYRYFHQRLKEEIDRADRYSYTIALVMMDVDNFKTLNDAYGHPLGDKVLEFLAQTIRGNIRRIDLAARYGGDEFVLVLPEITEQEAWLMGARLLNALKGCTLRAHNGDSVTVAVTMGVGMYPSDARNSRDLIEAADRALYWAKKNNRGDISFYRNIPGNAEKTA